MMPQAPAGRRPSSAPTRSAGKFLYASTWMSPEDFREMYEDCFHPAIDGFSEQQSPQCTRTVARRVNKLITSGVPLHRWNVQNILDWLEFAGLYQHRELFRRAEVTGDMLCKTTVESLKAEIGIKSIGHRENIVEKLRQLKGFMSHSTSHGISPSSPDTPRSAVLVDSSTEHTLQQLRSQRSQWVRDRANLMTSLGKPSFMDADPENWTKQQVCAWLGWIGLSAYRRNFIHGSIDGKLLMRLTLRSLHNDVGIQSLEHRRFLLERRAELTDTSEHPQPQDTLDDSVRNDGFQDVVQNHVKECDFNIMRLDQKIAKVKKSLGIEQPKTQWTANVVMPIVAQEAEERDNKPADGLSTWERQYRKHEDSLKRLREKVLKEIEKTLVNSPTSDLRKDILLTAQQLGHRRLIEDEPKRLEDLIKRVLATRRYQKMAKAM